MNADQLPLFDPAPGMVGRNHPDTSRDAAAAVTGRTGTQRRRVFDYIARCGAEGATDDEIQTGLGMGGNTQRPRRVELVDAGVIVDSGRRRQLRAGRRMIVWVRS